MPSRFGIHNGGVDSVSNRFFVRRVFNFSVICARLDREKTLG